jgi:hypothetical protein
MSQVEEKNKLVMNYSLLSGICVKKVLKQDKFQ